MADERFGKDREPLTDFEKNLMKRLFTRSQDFPQEFWSGVKGRIEIDPPSTLVSSVAGTYNVPRAHVYSSVSFSHDSSGNWLSITYNQERYDTSNMWDSGSPSRLTAQRPGTYMVGGHVVFDSNATGIRFVRLIVNNTGEMAHQGPIAATSNLPRFSICGLTELGRGDYVEMDAYQNSGGTVLIDGGTGYSCEFWAVFVADNFNAGA